jgi:hypothetical protein
MSACQRPKPPDQKIEIHEQIQRQAGRPSEYQKFRFHFSETSAYHNRVPLPQEGRFAIVTSVGRGMRWTQSIV